jgi:FkbM family methyltransferase
MENLQMAASNRLATTMFTVGKLLDRAAIPKKPWAQRIINRVPSPYRNDVITLDGLTLRVPGSQMRRIRLLRGDDPSMVFLKSVLKPGQTFVDVGANFGHYALVAAGLVGPSGQVFAVEPATDSLEVLRKNVRTNQLKNVVVLPYAAGARQEERAGECDAMNTPYSPVREMNGAENSAPEGARVLKVQTARLDDLVATSVDIVKINGAGTELEVLIGMTRILSADRPLTLVVKWNPRLQERAGYTPSQLPLALLDLGLRVQVLNHDRRELHNQDEIEQMISSELSLTGKEAELVAWRE